VRILLVGMSNMLSDIVTAALVHAHDFVVVGNIGEREDLLSQIRQTRADVVIVQSLQSGAPESFLPMLHVFPTLTIVAIGPTGSGLAHQLRLHSVRIAELSVETLQSVLRTDPDWSQTS
jgi:hypothetical protein